MKKHHYEWFLYTDNLCDGRVLLAQAMTYSGICRKRYYASMDGITPYMGATTIEKHRVYDE